MTGDASSRCPTTGAESRTSSGKTGRAALSVAAACLLAACGRAQQVVVYASLDDQALAWAESSFEGANPDVDVRLVAVPANRLIERLADRGNDPRADLAWGAPSWVLAAAAADGLLAETAPPWAGDVPDAWKDPRGRWVGSLVDPVVFAVNHDSVSLSRAPRDWIDLLHPQWTDQILVPEPGASDVGTVVLGQRAEAAVREYGDVTDAMDWFRRLDGVRAAYVADDQTMMRDLTRGAASLALARLSTAEAAAEADPAVAYVVPESGGPVVVEGVARVAGAEHSEAAGRFLAWLGSAAVAPELEAKLRQLPAWVAPDGDVPAWMARAWRGFTPRDVPADTLAAHLETWVAAWRSEARGRGVRVLIP